MKRIKFETLLGKTLTNCEGQVRGKVIVFTTTEGKQYQLFHEQDCCEHVSVEDICGDLRDLIGSPIIQAEENFSRENPPGVNKKSEEGSFTWTFYRLATAKGQVVIRWYGDSNGYYSESVDFFEL